jgi:hypothetical protein
MQGYQRHIARQGGHGPGALNPCPIGRLTVEGDSPLSYVYQPALGRGGPAVPVSPGHVRPLHTYPPSRRRRR